MWQIATHPKSKWFGYKIFWRGTGHMENAEHLGGGGINCRGDTRNARSLFLVLVISSPSFSHL